MQLLQNFTDFVKKENLFQQKDKLILAVSGGLDSVVLCALCKQADYDFVIAHCNFQLRGEESERDEQFVKRLGEKYNVEVLVKQFGTEIFAKENQLSIQVAARELRYKWFKELIGQVTNLQSINNGQRPPDIVHRTSYIAHTKVITAHHANDSIETLMMNFFKGTGIKGLQGILPKSGASNYLVRPLLFATKEEIRNFAEENKLAFAEDSSNSSDKYTRNYFRNQLLPGIQKVFPRVEQNLMDNLQRFKDIEILYNQSIRLHIKKLLEKKGEEIHIPVLKLLKSQPLATIIYEVIKEFNFTANQTPEVARLLQSESGKYIQSPSHKIFKNRNWLVISPIDTTIAQNILIEEKDRQVVYPNGKFKIEILPANNRQIPMGNETASVDASRITFPLLLRKWKQGDYFYPLGMQKLPTGRQGKKKLSRFFIDQKMSMTEKENTWVIEMNKKIIWIVGKRIDDRFKITPSTTHILKISQY